MTGLPLICNAEVFNIVQKAGAPLLQGLTPVNVLARALVLPGVVEAAETGIRAANARYEVATAKHVEAINAAQKGREKAINALTSDVSALIAQALSGSKE